MYHYTSKKSDFCLSLIQRKNLFQYTYRTLKKGTLDDISNDPPFKELHIPDS